VITSKKARDILKGGGWRYYPNLYRWVAIENGIAYFLYDGDPIPVLSGTKMHSDIVDFLESET